MSDENPIDTLGNIVTKMLREAETANSDHACREIAKGVLGGIGRAYGNSDEYGENADRVAKHLCKLLRDAKMRRDVPEHAHSVNDSNTIGNPIDTLGNIVTKMLKAKNSDHACREIAKGVLGGIGRACGNSDEYDENADRVAKHLCKLLRDAKMRRDALEHAHSVNDSNALER